MSDNRVRVWFAVFVLVVFCAGLAGGVVIGRRMGPPLRPIGPPFAGMFGGRGVGPQGPGRLIDRLSEVLQLSTDQRSKVEAILSGRREKLEQLNQDVIARAEKERQDMQSEIRAVLTPEQQRRFDEWLARAPGRGPFGRGMRGPYGPPR